jgi:hypothetical protein
VNAAGATAIDWIHSGKKVGSTLFVPFTSGTASGRHEYLVRRETNGAAALALGSFEQTAPASFDLEAREWDAVAGVVATTETGTIDSVGVSFADHRTGEKRSGRWDDPVPAATALSPSATHGNILDVSANNCGACWQAAYILINTVGCTVIGWFACLSCAVAGPIGAICAIACGSIIALICWYNEHGLRADASGICWWLGFC